MGAAGAALVGRQTFLQRRFERALQAGIHRGAHGVARVGKRFEPGEGARLAGHVIDEVEAGILARGIRRLDAEIGGQRRIHLRLGDRALFLHPAQHVGAPLPRPLRVLVGAVIVRALWQAGEQGGLGQRQRADRLPEPRARRHLDAVGAAAEIDPVEVEPEDLRLGLEPLQPRGHDHLADLALVGDVVAHRQVFHHLLRNGRAAGRPSRRGEVADEGADHTALVDAVVLVETLVLGRDEGLLHEVGHAFDRHDEAAPMRLEGLGIGLARRIQDDAGAGQLDVAQGLGRGQVLHGVVVEGDHRRRLERRIGRVLTLAELLVARVQLGDVEPVQDLGRVVARHRARILHGGGDQLVEVDILDVERLAHVGAAVAQDRHDLPAILGRVELGPHRVGPRRDLGQGQRGREQLDQDGVHRAVEAPGRHATKSVPGPIKRRTTRLIYGQARPDATGRGCAAVGCGRQPLQRKRGDRFARSPPKPTRLRRPMPISAGAGECPAGPGWRATAPRCPATDGSRAPGSSPPPR